MKNLLIIPGFFFLLLLIPFSSHAQEKDIKEEDVPAAVKNALAKKYPDSHVKEWEYDASKKVYEADFKFAGQKYEARFKADGTWISSERELKKDELPAEVLKAFHESDYKGWKIHDIEHLQSSGIADRYVIEVEKNAEHYYLYYDVNGKLLKRKPKK